MTLSHKQARTKHINAYRNSLRDKAIANEKEYQASIRLSKIMDTVLYYVAILGGVIVFLTMLAMLGD